MTKPPSSRKPPSKAKTVKRVKQSIYIDKALYAAFQAYCDEKGFILSRKIELLIEKFLRDPSSGD